MLEQAELIAPPKHQCGWCGEPVPRGRKYCDASCLREYVENAVPAPTPEEIAARCIEIRATWSEHEETTRRVGWKYQPTETQRIVMNGGGNV